MQHRVHPDDVLSGEELERITDALTTHVPTVTRRTYAILKRGLDPKDAERVTRCRGSLHLIYSPETRTHGLWPERCQLDLWCPHCCIAAYESRVTFQRDRIASLNTTRSVFDAPEAALYHVVVTSPPFLRPLLQHRSALMAFQRACVAAVAAGFGATSDKDRAAWLRTHGGFLNLHPWGNSDPFGWSPHYDMLVAGFEEDGTYAPLRWPARYEESRTAFRRALQAEMKPYLGHLPVEQIAAAHETLQTNFRVNLKIVVRRKDTPDERELVLPEEAIHTIRYSCRSFFMPCYLTGEKDKTTGRVKIRYENPLGARGSVYEEASAPFFRRLYALADFLGANHFTHRPFGVLYGQAYTKRMAELGRAPVVERKRTGRKRLGTYVRHRPGEFEYVPAPTRGGPA